jgi:hypothetical protein
MSTSSDTSTPLPAWLELVREKVARLQYGVIELVIHDGRVTQIQCTEKTRVPVSDRAD